MSGESETAQTIHNAGKVHLADSLRMMGDNHKTVQMTNESDRRVRDLHARTEEAVALARFPDMAPASKRPEESEDMKISIDSPVTTNNHYESAPEPPHPATTGLLPKLALGAGLLAAGVGVGSQLPISQPQQPTAEPPVIEVPVIEAIDNDTQAEWRIEFE